MVKGRVMRGHVRPTFSQGSCASSFRHDENIAQSDMRSASSVRLLDKHLAYCKQYCSCSPQNAEKRRVATVDCLPAMVVK